MDGIMETDSAFFGSSAEHEQSENEALFSCVISVSKRKIKNIFIQRKS